MWSMYAWSPDGTKIAITDVVDLGALGEKPVVAATHVVDVTTKEKKRVKLPDNHVITDWTPDGKHFLTTQLGSAEDKEVMGFLYLMNLDGSEYKRLTDGKEIAWVGRISPDGKRVLFSIFHPSTLETRSRRELRILEIASGKVTPLADRSLDGSIHSYCWSPDGRRIAYTWCEFLEKGEKSEFETHLVVCDSDGKNQKTIATEKAGGQLNNTIGDVDWR